MRYAYNAIALYLLSVATAWIKSVVARVLILLEHVNKRKKYRHISPGMTGFSWYISITLIGKTTRIYADPSGRAI
jgi:hypothetical protein